MHHPSMAPIGGAGGGVVSPPPSLAAAPGAAMQRQQYAQPQAPPRGLAQPQPPAPAPQQAYQGTLPPGTRVHVGAITVTVKRYLSQGGFAHVYLVTTEQPIPMPVSSTSAPSSTSSSTRGETTHVLKRMAVPDKETLALVRSEVEIHRSLRNHPNIISFIEASATNLQGGGYEVFILMEFAAGGGIIDLMNARLRTRLSEREVLKIFGDVASGLSVMHHMDPPLMHRDLKVENILLAPPPKENPAAGPTYKLCDFGSSTPILSRRAPRSLEEVKRLEADLNRHTTLQYRAPEMVDVYQRRVIDEKADIWAMGVLLYKLCYYTTPFEENGGGPLAILNVQYRFPPMPPYSQKLKNLISSMLQEQSSARPTIDQLIISVHQILGTKPPASAVHYAQLATSGKQMQALPSVVSSSSHLTGSAAADAAAQAMAQQRQKADRAGADGVDKDLIAKGPSAAERKRAEEEELRKRSEGITPMRRGRPTRANQTASSTTAPTSTPFSAATGSHSAGQTRSNKENATPGSAEMGFSDSFAPAPATKAASPPPSKLAASSAPGPPSRPSSSTSDVRQRETPLNHSPALPGFRTPSHDAARISPLPTASAAPSASQGQDDEASSRFPSVEELDARYASPPPKSSVPPTRRWKEEENERDQRTSQAIPRSKTTSNVTIPGLSNRQSLSAIAGKFGGTVGSPVTSPPTSSAMAAPSANHQASFDKPSGSVMKRWNHESSASITTAPSTSDRRSSYLTATSTSSSKKLPPAPEMERRAPALPQRQPKPKDWLTGDESVEDKPTEDRDAYKSPARYGPQSIGVEKLEDAHDASESSGDEEEGPEDLDKPAARERATPTHVAGNIVSQRLQARKDSAPTLPAPSKKPTLPPGKIRPPAWIEAEPRSSAVPKEETEEREKMTSDAEMDKMAQEAEKALEKFIGAGASTDDGPSPVSVDATMTKVSAPAPSWDEDDEEMQFIAPPALQGNGAEVSNLVELGTPVHKAPPVKTYVEASTSPMPSPVSRGPEEQKPLSKEAPAKPPVVAPKPTRKSTAREVAEIMSKYEGLSTEDPSLSSPSQPESDKLISSPSMAASSNGPKPDEQPAFDKVPEAVPKQQRKDSMSSTYNGSVPPKPSSSKPSSWQAATKPSGAGQFAHLKPWEREAAEKAQVEKYGSLRDQDEDEGDGEPSSARLSRKGEAQERFTGVSNLISQWQANAQKGAPGWGTIGSPTTKNFGTKERKKSQDDSGAIDLGRSRTNASSSTMGPTRGSRLAERDV